MRYRFVNRDRHYMSSIRFSPIAEQVRLHRNYEMMKKIGYRGTIIQRGSVVRRILSYHLVLDKRYSITLRLGCQQQKAQEHLLQEPISKFFCIFKFDNLCILVHDSLPPAPNWSRHICTTIA